VYVAVNEHLVPWTADRRGRHVGNLSGARRRWPGSEWVAGSRAQRNPAAAACRTRGPGLALPIVALVALADGRQAASLKLRSANGRLLGSRDGPSGQLGVSGAGRPGTVPCRTSSAAMSCSFRLLAWLIPVNTRNARSGLIL
jgi:hypothetical protein